MMLAAIAWEPIAAVIIAVVGWYVTHRAQLKAQKEQLRHQILNEARIEITESLRRYQRWLTRMSSALLTAAILFENQEYQHVSWETRYREWTEHLNQRPQGKYWLAALEEYDVLFPELRGVRPQLSERQREVDRRVRSILDDLRTFFDGRIPKLAEAGLALRPTSEFIFDQGALMEDLRIHLQNRALGEIAGEVAPGRDPPDPVAPRLSYRGGQLTLVEKANAKLPRA